MTSKKRVTTYMCGKCKKVFPVGQGHNARTCEKNRKPPLPNKVKNSTSPALSSRTKTYTEKSSDGGNEKKEYKQEKSLPQKEGGKNFVVAKKVPLELFSGLTHIEDSGEVRISYSKNFPSIQSLPLEWRKEYNCISDANKTVWFNEEGQVHNSSGEPAVTGVSGTQKWWVNGKLHREGGPAVKWANGSEEWRINGELHRADGPAKTDRKGNKEWRVDGKLHRLNGPAIEHTNGYKEWWVDGKLHRLNGPAVEWANGTKEWWVDGEQHRIGGPAVEQINGEKEWWVNGKRHRLDGPAVEKANGRVEWWVHGRYLSLHADHPDIPRMMGEYFYLLCVNSNPHIRKLALANPNCPLAYKVVAQILQK